MALPLPRDNIEAKTEQAALPRRLPRCLPVRSVRRPTVRRPLPTSGMKPWRRPTRPQSLTDEVEVGAARGLCRHCSRPRRPAPRGQTTLLPDETTMPPTPSRHRTRPLSLPDEAMVATERPARRDNAAVGRDRAASGRDHEAADAQLSPDEAAVVAVGKRRCCRRQRDHGPRPVFQSTAAPPGGAGRGCCRRQMRPWRQRSNPCHQTVLTEDKTAQLSLD